MIRAALLLAALVAPGAQSQDAPPWRWILGKLDDPTRQAAYEEHARGIFGYYQERGIMEGVLVKESELGGLPSSRFVFLGPLEAFEGLEPSLPELRVKDAGGLLLGGVPLTMAGTGIFLRGARGDVLAYTGTDEAGYRSVFSVPTGHEDCTVLVGGRVRWHGERVDGTLRLVAERFTPRLADALLEAPPSPDPSPWRVERVLEEDGATLTVASRGRLSELCSDARVLFVGETHWNEGVNRLFLALLRELLARPDGMSALFLETNDSSTEPLDHFVHLVDDAEAARFRRDVLEPLLAFETHFELLELLRQHNRSHPERSVRVACHDMEWHAERVIEHVLEPFFEGVEPRVRFSSARLRNGRGRERLAERWTEALAAAREAGRVGPEPYVTADYVERVLENLLETLEVQEGTGIRQEYLVRHLQEHHAELLDEGLVVFKGGAYHARRVVEEDPSVRTEAVFLQEEHAPTKGRVRTLFLRALGYDFGSVTELDLGASVAWADLYARLVLGYQEDLRNGRVRPEDRYLLEDDPLDACEAFGVRAARGAGLDRVWLLPATGDGLEPQGCPSYRDYDAWILVLDGRLEPLRRRPGAGD